LWCLTERLGTKEAEMKIVGCDLHARQQTIAMVDTETGEFSEKTLAHEGGMVRELYAGFRRSSGSRNRSHRGNAVVF
jgi:hypothetical protein